MEKNKASGLLINSKRNPKRIEFLRKKATFKELRKYVRGCVEFIWLKNGDILVVNEEREMLYLPHNPIATKIIKENGINDCVYGNAVLINLKDIL